MSSRLIAGLMLGTSVVLSACAASDPDPPTATFAPNPDTVFVQSMVAYHDHNLIILTLADAQADDAEVRTLAAQTAGLQRLQRTTMVTLLAGWSQPTTAPTSADDDHLTILEKLRGAAFDRALVATMISHNDDAIRFARQALTAPLPPQTHVIAVSVDTGLSAENAALRLLLSRLDTQKAHP